MTGAEFITHKGIKILNLDLRNEQDIEKSATAFRTAQKLATSEPPKSVRLITDVTGAHYTSEGVSVIKEFSSAVTPYMKGSAIVGVTGIKQIIVQSLVRLSGREMKLFKTREDALEWLTNL